VTKNTYSIGYTLLVIIGISLILMGSYICFLKMTPMFSLFGIPIDKAFWGEKPIDVSTIRFKGFIYSVYGLSIIMWGLFHTCIVIFGIKKYEKWAWNTILISACIWYPISIFYSIYYGVVENAMGGTIFMVFMVVSLYMTRKIEK